MSVHTTNYPEQTPPTQGDVQTREAWNSKQEEAEVMEKPATFKDLAEETTMHGIAKAVNSKYSWFRR